MEQSKAVEGAVENNNSPPSEEEEQEEPTLFQIELEIVVKDFTNQKSGASSSSFHVHCNSVKEFCQVIWSIIEKYIEKELMTYDFFVNVRI